MQGLHFSALSQDYKIQEGELSQVRDILISLFKWNNDANEEFIYVLEKASRVPAQCLEILSHIVNVHELWLNRITNVQDNKLQPWDKLGKIDLTLKNSNNYYVTLGLLASEGYGRNIKWTFGFVNHEGKEVDCILSDAYFHVLSHSSYHRGQIAYILKENKMTPPDTNFIMVKNDLANSCG